MTLYDLIQDEHREIRDILKELLTANFGDPSEARVLFETLKDELHDHCRREERLFYPELRRGDIEIQVDQAKDDHKRIQAHLATLGSLRPDSPEWITSVRQLETELRVHLDFEENVLFEKGQVVVSEEKAERIARKWQEAKGIPSQETA